MQVGEVRGNGREDVATAWREAVSIHVCCGGGGGSGGGEAEDMRTVKPQHHLLRFAAPQPVGFGAVRQHERLRREAVLLAEPVVRVRGGDAQVGLLVEGEVGELHAHHGEHDVLEVGVGAGLALEGRRDQTGRRGEHCGRGCMLA